MFGFVLFTCVLKVLSHEMEPNIRCGSLDQCLCAKTGYFSFTEMDCSFVNVTLRDVCSFMGRQNSSITKLQYNSNNVTILKKEDLLGCQNLTKILLRNSSINRIENNTFSIIKNLTLLDLSSNSLDIHDDRKPYFLHGLSSLQELRLNGNMKPGQVSYPNLEDVLDLETLHLDGLFHTEIEYPYLKHLANLRLSGTYGSCNLGEITNDTFRLVTHLKKLDISNCNITNVHAGAFVMLYQLTWLDMSYNMELGFSPLRNISYGLQFTKIDFLNLTKLQSYFDRCTRLTRGDVCFLKNTTLREVVLDSNKIDNFDKNLVLLMPDTLQMLRIRDNTFTFGLYVLQLACLFNMTTLDIAFQSMPHMPLKYLMEPIQKTFPITHHTSDCIFDNFDIHQRDFIAGRAVTDNIIGAIQNSRKTVIILSKAFLESKLCLYEFHMARTEGIYSRAGNCLIIVMLENMPPNKLMPLEMMEWIKQESYIEYTEIREGNRLFWERLKEAILS